MHPSIIHSYTIHKNVKDLDQLPQWYKKDFGGKEGFLKSRMNILTEEGIMLDRKHIFLRF